MRIAIATDAWTPQVNGVVRTLQSLGRELGQLGHEARFFTPAEYATLPCPGYPEIRLAIWPRRRMSRQLEAFDPEAVHIATEGPVGMAARRWCLQHAVPFTTSLHTQFPEYLRLRAPVPLGLSYAWLRRFHGAAVRTLVPTRSMQQRLRRRGFDNLVLWSRGVDTRLFRPLPRQEHGWSRPVFLYVGRVAVEKNLQAFLDLELPGTMVVVGDGPDLQLLRRDYPGVIFTGYRHGEELAQSYADADVFVFPSRTDTFGLVLLEAMACGLPVAAFPVTGPADVVRQGVTGVLDEDLRRAALAALSLDRDACLEQARAHGWRECAEAFVAYLQVRMAHACIAV